MVISGNLIDAFHKEIYPCSIVIENKKIVSIKRNQNHYDCFILPGFVDAHIHIESSMLLPDRFGQMVLPKGTIAVLNDPHEIANVLGISGIEMMMEAAQKSPVKFFFGIPSSVPATPLDSAGSVLTTADIETLAKTGKFKALSEVMNVPGVLNQNSEVISKIEIAKKYHLRVDGHAPGLKGEKLTQYIAAGIETDHESISREEAEEKIEKGMKILIREGSAAKNWEALKSLIPEYPDQLMFCTDDAHPDEIISEGHIDKFFKKGIKEGFDIFDLVKIASINPVEFYRLDVGLLREGDRADFIVIDNPVDFNLFATYIDGKKIEYDHSVSDTPPVLNGFDHLPIQSEELKIELKEEIPVIQIIPDEIITKRMNYTIKQSPFESDLHQDILKIVYINRYSNGKPQIGFIQGFNLKEGAMATTIAHDSHNIIAVGCSDEALKETINHLIELKGGLVVKNNNGIISLPLPYGGIISGKQGEEVAEEYLHLNETLRQMGCKLHAPFMTLSFMALIVVPALKIGERGLFDVEKFEFIA